MTNSSLNSNAFKLFTPYPSTVIIDKEARFIVGKKRFPLPVLQFLPVYLDFNRANALSNARTTSSSMILLEYSLASDTKSLIQTHNAAVFDPSSLLLD